MFYECQFSLALLWTQYIVETDSLCLPRHPTESIVKKSRAYIQQYTQHPAIYPINFFFTKQFRSLENWDLYRILRTIIYLTEVSHLYRICPIFLKSWSPQRKDLQWKASYSTGHFYPLLYSRDFCRSCRRRGYCTSRFMLCGAFSSWYLRMVWQSSLVPLYCPRGPLPPYLFIIAKWPFSAEMDNYTLYTILWGFHMGK